VLGAFAAAGAEPLLDEPEAEPERPAVVPEGGCSIVASGTSGSAPRAGLVGLAALGLGLAFRRRRG
jgi:MYXO-CTERM domain-containing protein